MVERKKTGLAKARKRVSHPYSTPSRALLIVHAVRLGQALACNCQCYAVSLFRYPFQITYATTPTYIMHIQ